MERMASTDGPSTNTTAEDLRVQIEMLRADLAELTATVAEIGRDTREEFEDEARRAGSGAQDFIEARLRDFEHQIQGVEAQARAFFSRQPGLALGLAAGIGFLVGYFGNRR